MKRFLAAAVVTVLAALMWFGFKYRSADLETENLDDNARSSSPGAFVKTALGTVHYELAGPASARTVVLVHGFSVPYYLWDPTFKALVDAGFRVLRYDLFGRGLSDRPAAVYNSDLFDRQLIDLLQTLEITGRIDLMGSSLGGPISTTFACRHPDRVRTLSLFDPGYSHGQPMPFKIRTPLLGEYTMAVNLAPHLPQAQMADFEHPDKFPDWPDRYKPQMRYRGFRRALLSTLRDHLPEDWSKSFACAGRTGVPALVVWGRADRDMPFEMSREVLANLPQAEFLPVDDSAHVPFLEHPEIVNSKMLLFLSRH